MANYNYYIDRVNGNDSWDGTTPSFVSGTTGPWKTCAAVQNNKTSGEAWQTKVNGGDKVVLYFSGTTMPLDPDSPVDFYAAFKRGEIHRTGGGGVSDLTITGTTATKGQEFEITSYGDHPAVITALNQSIFDGEDVGIGFRLQDIYECDFDGPDPSVARAGSNVWRMPYTSTAINFLYEDGNTLRRASSIKALKSDGNAYWEKDRDTGASIAMYYTPINDDSPFHHWVDRNATPTAGVFKDCQNIKIHGLIFITAPIGTTQGTPGSTMDQDGWEIYNNVYRHCTPNCHVDDATAWEIKNVYIHDNDIRYFANDGISIETDGSGSNKATNIKIIDNEVAYCDYDGINKSWMAGYADYLGEWKPAPELTVQKRDVVSYYYLGANENPTMDWYRNTTGTNTATDPRTDTTNWTKLPLVDNEGIVVQNPNYCIIENNVCHHGFAGGSIVIWTQGTANLSKYLRINGNILYNLNGPGIACGTGATDLVNTDVYIYGNIIRDWLPDPNGWEDSTGRGDGIRLNGSNTLLTNHCFNNVIANVKTGFNLNSVSVGWQIENNIVINCDWQFVKRFESGGMQSFLDKNIYWNIDGSERFNYKGTIYNFADWLTAIRADTYSNNEESSQVTDPQLGKNYEPISYDLLFKKGNFVKFNTTGNDGHRFKLPPSIGAYEFGRNMVAQTGRYRR